MKASQGEREGVGGIVVVFCSERSQIYSFPIWLGTAAAATTTLRRGERRKKNVCSCGQWVCVWVREQEKTNIRKK